jgi:hypothetical protein
MLVWPVCGNGPASLLNSPITIALVRKCPGCFATPRRRDGYAFTSIRHAAYRDEGRLTRNKQPSWPPPILVRRSTHVCRVDGLKCLAGRFEEAHPACVSRPGAAHVIELRPVTRRNELAESRCQLSDVGPEFHDIIPSSKRPEPHRPQRYGGRIGKLFVNVCEDSHSCEKLGPKPDVFAGYAAAIAAQRDRERLAPSRRRACRRTV